MAEGRREHDWAQTAELLALTANVNRDPKKTPKAYMADDLNPMRQGDRHKPFTDPEADTPLAFDMMKRLWAPQQEHARTSTPSPDPETKP